MNSKLRHVVQGKRLVLATGAIRDVAGRNVSLDALHTQTETARQLVMDHGANYLLTVKDSQPTIRANIEKKIPAPEAGFSPSESDR